MALLQTYLTLQLKVNMRLALFLAIITTSFFSSPILSTGENLTVSCSQEQDLRIPVVDMRDYYNPDKKAAFLDTLYNAMREVGFFAILNTGVDCNVVNSAYQQSEAFFKQDLAQKMNSYTTEMHGQRGFIPGESAKGASKKDRKEFYCIGRENSAMPNIWPSKPFETAFVTLYAELERYVIPLQEAIVESINQNSDEVLPLDLLNKETVNGISLFRAIYYPPLSNEEVGNLTEPVFWGAPHTDIDLLAILPRATEKGLQVEIDGQWLNVVVPEDAFIVNVGDMLQNLTNGLFVSAKHRVVAIEPNKERFSMVLFVHPLDETALDPIEACIRLTGGQQVFAPGTRQEFLWERLLELGIAPVLLEPYSKMGHVERQIQYGRESPQVVDMLIKNGLASPEVLAKYGVR